MGRSFFIWNGFDCRSMGVLLTSPVPIVRPEERAEHVQIPGRSGDLAELEGENIYNSYIQTASIAVKSWSNVRKVYQWLRGAGFVTFSGEPDRKQEARIIGAITLNKHSYNLDWWTGECQFYCQPLKQLLHETAEEFTASGAVILNSGDVEAKPRIKLTASGTSATVEAGGKSLTVTGLTSGNVYIIDSETCTATNADGTVNMLHNTSGGFPVLAVGENTVTGSGWSKIEMQKRERYL